MSVQEAFAPVARNTTIRMLLRFAAWVKAKVSTSDQRGAFLASDLEKNSEGETKYVWMEPPPNFYSKDGKVYNVDGKGSTHLIRLSSSVYGLKIAANILYKLTKKNIENMGYTPSDHDDAVWFKFEEETGRWLIVSTWVDDHLMISS